jgi:hypothetical protein
LEQLQANGQIKLSWRADGIDDRQSQRSGIQEDTKNMNRPGGKAKLGKPADDKVSDDDRLRNVPGSAGRMESRDSAASSAGGPKVSPEAKTAMGREASPQPPSENAPVGGFDRREKFKAEKSLDAVDKADVFRLLDQNTVNGSLSDGLGYGGGGGVGGSGGAMGLGAAAPQGRAKRLAASGSLLKQIESGEFKTLTPAEALNSAQPRPTNTPVAEPAKPQIKKRITEEADKENAPAPAAAPTPSDLPATISDPKDRTSVAERDSALAKEQNETLEKLNESREDGPSSDLISRDELDRPVPAFRQALFVIRIVPPNKAADSKPSPMVTPASPPSAPAQPSVPPTKSP